MPQRVYSRSSSPEQPLALGYHQPASLPGPRINVGLIAGPLAARAYEVGYPAPAETPHDFTALRCRLAVGAVRSPEGHASMQYPRVFDRSGDLASAPGVFRSRHVP